MSKKNNLYKKTMINISGLSFKINPKIFNFLYFVNCSLENTKNKYAKYYAINTTLPIKQIEALTPRELNLWPLSYESMTPGQRYVYIQWLTTDLSSIENINCALLLIMCLDQRILHNSMIKESMLLIDEINSLSDKHAIKEFSSAALAYVIFKCHQTDILKLIHINNYEFHLATILKNKLSVDDLILIAPKVKFSNRRYMRKYPKYYKKALKEVLTNNFSEPYFTYSFPETDQKEQAQKRFMTRDFDISIDDIFSNDHFCSEICQILKDANEEVKSLLKIVRASSK